MGRAALLKPPTIHRQMLFSNTRSNRPWPACGNVTKDIVCAFSWKHVTCKSCLRYNDKRYGEEIWPPKT